MFTVQLFTQFYINKQKYLTLVICGLTRYTMILPLAIISETVKKKCLGQRAKGKRTHLACQE